MATKKKVKSIDIEALRDIVRATLAESFMYASAMIFEPLIAEGLAEINEEFRDEHGNIATRATQKGIDMVESKQTEVKEEKVKSQYVLEMNIPLPTVAARGRRQSEFPFDVMDVGMSFFVPNDEKRVDAAKSLASTVSAANARYSVVSADGATRQNRKGETVPVMNKTRVFTVRSEVHNGVAGARVWRTK